MRAFDQLQASEGRYEDLIEVKRLEGNVYRILEEDIRKGTRETIVDSDTREEEVGVSHNINHSLLKRLEKLGMPNGILYSIRKGIKPIEAGRYDEIPFALPYEEYLKGITSKGFRRWQREGPYAWIAVLRKENKFSVYQILDASHREYVNSHCLDDGFNSLEEAVEEASRISKGKD